MGLNFKIAVFSLRRKSVQIIAHRCSVVLLDDLYLAKITMGLQFRTLSSRLPASCCDSPKVTASSSRRTRSTIW